MGPGGCRRWWCCGWVCGLARRAAASSGLAHRWLAEMPPPLRCAACWLPVLAGGAVRQSDPGSSRGRRVPGTAALWKRVVPVEMAAVMSCMCCMPVVSCMQPG